jgi:hypothetical protein
LLGTAEKCAALWQGKPLAAHVADAALHAGAERIAVVCGTETRSAIGETDARISFAESGPNPVESASNGVQVLGNAERIVFLPGDLPLLRGEHIRDFVDRFPTGAQPWVSAGIAAEPDIRARFPNLAGLRTMTLSRQKYCGGGLFAASSAGFKLAHSLASSMSGHRKSQLKMAVRFGPVRLFRYFIGAMSVNEAEVAAAKLFGCAAHIAVGCAPESIMDVDEPDDWSYLLNWFEDQRTAAASSST